MANFLCIDILFLSNNTFVADQWILYYDFTADTNVAQNHTIADLCLVANLDVSSNDALLDDYAIGYVDIFEVTLEKSYVAFLDIKILVNGKQIWDVVKCQPEKAKIRHLLLKLLSLKIGSNERFDAFKAHVSMFT